jgi:hypothetical protein
MPTPALEEDAAARNAFAVLVKNSNTNMDFTWVTSDDANAIQNTIVDAKGDLIAASASDTPARLAVGANNTLLVADSAEATGLKWAGGWTTWTPTYQNFTLGNGTVTARYQHIGNTVNVYVKVLLGSTSSITGGVGVSGQVTCGALSATTITETSSITLKENINPIENALTAVLALQAYTYDRKDGSIKNEAGLIAEEVFKIIPNLVQLDKDGKPEGIKYTKMTAYLIESIKALNEVIHSFIVAI